MQSIRQDKIGHLIQKELSEIFQQNGVTFFGKAFVTVTVVRVTADLGVARIYMSVFATQDKEQLIHTLNMRAPEVRNLLGQRVRHQLRKIPEPRFYLDDSLDHEERITDLLK